MAESSIGGEAERKACLCAKATARKKKQRESEAGDSEDPKRSQRDSGYARKVT